MDVAALVVEQTGQQVDELSDAIVIPTWRRNAPGSATLTVPTSTSFAELLAPKRELQVWIDGVCRWWGVPDLGRRESGQPSTTIELVEVWGLLSERVLKTTLRHDQVDQATIIQDLVERAQDGAGRSYALGTDIVATGKLRDREYLRDERPKIIDLILALTEIHDGPDVWQTVTADGLLRALAVRQVRGSRKDDWTLEYGAESIANVVDYSWSWTRPSANDVEASADASEGERKIFGRYIEQASVDSWGQIQDVVAGADGTIKEATLIAKARGEVRRRAWPTILLSSVTVTGPDELLASGAPGDTVPVVIDDGPIQVAADYRIAEMTLDGYAGRAKLEIEPA